MFREASASEWDVISSVLTHLASEGGDEDDSLTPRALPELLPAVNSFQPKHEYEFAVVPVDRAQHVQVVVRQESVSKIGLIFGSVLEECSPGVGLIVHGLPTLLDDPDIARAMGCAHHSPAYHNVKKATLKVRNANIKEKKEMTLANKKAKQQAKQQAKQRAKQSKARASAASKRNPSQPKPRQEQAVKPLATSVASKRKASQPKSKHEEKDEKKNKAAACLCSV